MMMLMEKLKTEDRPTSGMKHLKIARGHSSSLCFFLCFSFSILLFSQSLYPKNLWYPFVCVMVVAVMTLGFLLSHSFDVPMLCLVVLECFLYHRFYGYRQSNRTWKILCWNIRGINAENKWDSIRNKITESNCDIINIQETKRSSFDLNYFRKFYPRSFVAFCFLPSIGASGGILVAWKSCFFSGLEIFQN